MPHLTFKRAFTGLIVLLALAILVSLGIWQLQRKAWKEALIADLANRAHAAAVTIPDRAAWPGWSPERDEFRHVFVGGTYLNDREIAVYGLMPASSASGRESGMLQGSYIFTPLQLEDGSVVFVNRGFMPKEAGVAADRVSGPVRIEGILRAPERRGWFVPENMPEKGQWFTRDSNAMATGLGLPNVAPFYIEADMAKDAPVGSWPRGGVTRDIVLKNDHLQYALTWFGLALTLLCVAGYALIRK